MSEMAFLRHTLAVLVYRASKTLRGAPSGFAGFRSNESSRTPAQILAHMGDLLDWAVALADGRHEWHNSEPLDWEAEAARFFAAAEALDRRLASGAPLGCSAEQLFQGPVADALTHTGQIGMLRRMAGSPVRGENYFGALITAGNVGRDQPAPVFEFD